MLRQKTAIDHINLAIEGTHIIGLLDRRKRQTTLIKMINGLLALPPVPSSCSRIRSAQRGKKLSYLPDHTYLNMNERVRDIIRYFFRFL